LDAIRQTRCHNKNLSDRIYRINRMICQAAPEDWPETCIRFAESGKRNRSICGLRLLSPPDCPPRRSEGVRSPADRRWLIVRRGGLPAGNILPILLILSKKIHNQYGFRRRILNSDIDSSLYLTTKLSSGVSRPLQRLIGSIYARLTNAYPGFLDDHQGVR
jgi:hypothetical protein